jgi:hypothetical protein
LYELAWQLKKEKRLQVFLSNPTSAVVYTVLLPSAESRIAGLGSQQLQEAYNKIKKGEFETWEEFTSLRAKFHIIKRCKDWPDFFLCNCYTAANAKPANTASTSCAMSG